MTQPYGDPATWQRPPFEPGNTIALAHGAYSERALAPLAAELRAELLADASLRYLAEPWAAGAVGRYVRAQAIVERVWARLCDLEELLAGDLDDEQRGRLEKRYASALELLHRFMRLADNQAHRLGLDALSRAEIARALAPKVDLAQQWAAEAAADEASLVDAEEITNDDTEGTL